MHNRLHCISCIMFFKHNLNLKVFNMWWFFVVINTQKFMSSFQTVWLLQYIVLCSSPFENVPFPLQLSFNMGRHFGNLAKVRHIITYSISPFEQRAFPNYFSKGIPNVWRRFSASFFKIAPRKWICVLTVTAFYIKHLLNLAILF